MYELFNRLKRNPNLFTKIIIASFFVNLLALATPIYVIQVLQRYVAYGVTSTLVTLIVGIIFVTIFEFFFRNIRHRMAREIEPFNAILSDSVLRKISSIKSSYFELHKNFRSDVISKHVQTIKSTLTGTTLLTLIDVPFVTIFLLALFLIHYQLGLIACLLIFLPFLILSLYRGKIGELSKKDLNASLSTSRLYDTSSSRFSTIRYFKLIGALQKAWNQIIRGSVLEKDELEANKNVLTSFMSMSSTLMTIVIIGWGAVLAVNGEITVGALIGANILGSRAISPIIRFVQTLESLQKSSKANEEINKFLQLPEEKKKGTEIKNVKGNLSVNNLYFIYPNTKNSIFENLNFNLNPGEILAVTGSNGSGKSTLIKTIIGLLEFNRGQIFIDNIEINQLSPEWLRENLIFMPQEPKFVDGTLLDNLIGLGEIKKEDMHEILRKVDLEEFVNSDPLGVNLIMSNRGEDLPFGIRKRIAFARSLNINGQIVVLDEPTESIDENGRNSFYKIINEFLNNNKTVIVSTQDDNIIKMADIMLNMDTKPSPEIVVRKS